MIWWVSSSVTDVFAIFDVKVEGIEDGHLCKFGGSISNHLWVISPAQLCFSSRPRAVVISALDATVVEYWLHWWFVLLLGSLNKVVVGVVEMKFELRPSLGTALTPDILSTQQTLERTNKAQRERLFITYAKRWWDEYLQIRSSHSQRLVKIFARVILTFWIFSDNANKWCTR